MAQKYPKVLIFGETFNRYSGGGVTLSNLFEGFPKENLAVISNYLTIGNSSNEICDSYYMLGRENYKSILQLDSFLSPPSSKVYKSTNLIKKKETSNKKAFLKNFLKKSGLIHNLRRYVLNEELLA